MSTSVSVRPTTIVVTCELCSMPLVFGLDRTAVEPDGTIRPDLPMISAGIAMHLRVGCEAT